MNKFLFLFILSCSLFACTSDSEPTTNEVDHQPRPRVSIQTPQGEMVFELFNETPKHRDNFIKKAKEGFYDSLLFHRVQANFMIQGGDPDSRGDVAPDKMLGMGGAQDRIPSEINSKFIMRQGALVAFHRGTGHYPDRSSNSSQFMIIHGQALKPYQVKEMALEKNQIYSDEQVSLYEKYGGSPQLDGDYTIFGQLVEGRHILDKIVAVKTHRSVDPTLPDRPIEDIRMVVKVQE